MPAPWRGVLAAVPWRAIRLFTGAATLLLGSAAIWPDTALMAVSVWLGVALLAGAAAFLLDERAADVVRSTPLPLLSRYAAHLAPALVLLALGLGLASGVAARSAEVSFWPVAAQLTAIVVVGLGAAAALTRRLPTPGERVAEGIALAVLTLLVAGGPLDRCLEVLTLSEPRHPAASVGLWLGATALGVGLIVRAARDPQP
jgi:hypothetical protein